MINSVAGGTGSGFGSRVAEGLRTLYPTKTILASNDSH